MAYSMKGQTIYETLPATCVDLNNCSVSTLDSWIEDSGMSDMDIPTIVDAGTVNGIYYAVTDRSIGIPDVILDVAAITPGVLRAAQSVIIW